MSDAAEPRPRHLAIAERIREELSHLHPGDELPSRQLLAKRLHATEETVQLALAHLEREELVETQSGTMPRLPAHPPKRFVAILCELDIAQPATSYFFLRIVQSLREFFTQAGVHHRLYVGRYCPGEAVAQEHLTCDDFVRDAEAGNLLACAAVCASESLVRRGLGGVDLPIVSTSMSGGPNWVDYCQMARMGVDYLVENGRRRLAFLEHQGANQSNGSPAAQAFVEALRSHRVPVVREWIGGAVSGGIGAPGADAFRRLWQARDEQPDGLVVLDDLIYYDLAPLLLYNRIVLPDQLLVVSHANKGNPRPMVPEPVRLEVDPDAFARAVGIELLRRIDQLSRTSENIPPVLRLIEDVAGSAGLQL